MATGSSTVTVVTDLMGSDSDLELDLGSLCNRVKVVEQNEVSTLQSDSYLKNRWETGGEGIQWHTYTHTYTCYYMLTFGQGDITYHMHLTALHTCEHAAANISPGIIHRGRFYLYVLVFFRIRSLKLNHICSFLGQISTGSYQTFQLYVLVQICVKWVRWWCYVSLSVLCCGVRIRELERPERSLQLTSDSHLHSMQRSQRLDQRLHMLREEVRTMVSAWALLMHQ